MRVAPAGLQTWLATGTNAVTRADLYTFTLLDGTVYRWTTCDRSLTVGGVTWSSSGAVLRRGATKQDADLATDVLNVTLSGVAQLGGSALSLLASQGLFDGARMKLDLLLMPTPGDVSLGVIPAWFEGAVSSVDPRPLEVALRVRSDTELLDQMLPKNLYQPACNHTVYDLACNPAQTMRAAKTVAGAVVSGITPTRSTFKTGLTQDSLDELGWFGLGVVAFASGTLAGQRLGISTFATATGIVTLSYPASAAPAVGDTFTIYPGCDGNPARCETVFSNTVHFRGFPGVPRTEGAR